MKLERLFHVLVVMGGAGAAGCTSDDDPAARQPPPPDAPAGGDADAAASPAEPDGGEVGSPCFCDSQACCDRSQTPAVVAPGFTCCWSTTCP